jgi:hypothetical protein
VLGIRVIPPQRQILAFLACVSPLLVLGGAWWAVDTYVLAPPVPSAQDTAEVHARFLAHPKGLPRLRGRRLEQFLDRQSSRLLTDAAFREQLAVALRRSPPESQEAARRHLAAAYKPRVMADVRRFHELGGAARSAYLDDRIVHYMRLASALRAGSGEEGQRAMRTLLPDREQIAQLLLSATSQEERALGMEFLSAYQARVQQIVADPDLKRQFETRIAALPP